MRRLGFSTIGCPDYTIGQVIEIAVASGLSGVEIRFLRGTVDLAGLEELSPQHIGETRRQFDDAGLTVVAIGTGVRMNALNPNVRQQQTDLAKTNLDIALGLGAKLMRVFGGPLPEDQDREQTLDAIAEGLGTIADMTARAGVTTVLETHDAFCTSENCLDLYRRGASPSLEILWDTLHSYRHGESAGQTWAQLGPRVRHVHIKDSKVATPTGFDCVLTGEGSVPIPDFIHVLDAANYDGYIHFEWEKGWHRDIPGPEIALPHFSRYMASLR